MSFEKKKIERTEIRDTGNLWVEGQGAREWPR